MVSTSARARAIHLPVLVEPEALRVDAFSVPYACPVTGPNHCSLVWGNHLVQEDSWWRMRSGSGGPCFARGLSGFIFPRTDPA